MGVAVITSVSANIARLAKLTLPNKAEYCLRHGYTLVADNMPYEQAAAATSRLWHYLDLYGTVWMLDCDAIITDMTRPIHKLSCLGPHVTVCREDIVPWNELNCGSMVWRDTPQARQLLHTIELEAPAWKTMPCGWQTWLGAFAADRPDVVQVVPPREFNSTEWTHPGGGAESPGCHWQPGDLVYHPCGVFPAAAKYEYIRRRLGEVVR